MGGNEKLVGRVAVDSGQLLVMDPANLPGDDAEPYYQRVVKVTLDGGGPVKFDAASVAGPDAVVVETMEDGTYPVLVIYGDDGVPTSIRIDLTT